jgi:hypothetical protein
MEASLSSGLLEGQPGLLPESGQPGSEDIKNLSVGHRSLDPDHGFDLP